MSLRRFLPKNRNTEPARSSLENDRPPTYPSNITDSADSLNDRMRALSGSDSVTLVSDKIESSLTDTLGVAETSEVATPRRFSKRLSGKFKFHPSLLICVNFVSILPDLC